jgi:hypothetical protein
MLFHPPREDRLGQLEEQLRRARAVTADLLTDVIARACVDFPQYGGAAEVRINRLIEAGAYTDAAMALLELELPHWKLRRLVYDDGEWICSLSRQPWLPVDLDDVAEARHEILPLAVLTTFLQALGADAADEPRAASVPQVRPAQGYAICCDNFS